LIGANAETDRAVARAVAEACADRPIDLCGETSIRELIALVSSSSAHLGGDTGSTHLAAALAKPAVSLYSITRPQRSCPYGQIERCHYDADSLTNIPSGAVLESLEAALN
jgi:ADP-heptose:LPS heptosyltransferase